MAALSIVRDDGPATLVTNGLFLLSEIDNLTPGSKIAFEVLESDVFGLQDLVGETHYYAMGSQIAFWGRIEPLEPCESTHPGLACLRARPTLRGCITVLADAKDSDTSQ